MALSIYYDKDADLGRLDGKTVAVIGYGSQGHAHAQNLQASGVSVVVGLRKDSPSCAKAEAAGLRVLSPAEAAREGEIVMLVLPDETAAQVYEDEISPNLQPGNYVAVAHGFNIHFENIRPKADTDVFMIAPKGPGHTVRGEYLKGGGVPCLIAIQQDPTGTAQSIGLAWANGIGGARAGVLETTFKEETETDLFGEQVVLCGGLTALIQAGYETLVEAGYAPEMAYFECLHEVKLIVDLIYEGGIANMRYSVSNTAEYGDFTRGPRIITDETRAEMRRILAEIQNGDFAKEFILENQSGAPTMKALRRISREHSVEKVGQRLRDMMPWIRENKLVDQSKN